MLTHKQLLELASALTEPDHEVPVPPPTQAECTQISFDILKRMLFDELDSAKAMQQIGNTFMARMHLDAAREQLDQLSMVLAGPATPPAPTIIDVKE